MSDSISQTQGQEVTIEELNEVRSQDVAALAGILTQRSVLQSELSGENAEVYLFQWLSGTEKRVISCTAVRHSLVL